MFGMRGNRWKDADEYKKARWAYEGQAASATKSSWFLGAALIAMTAFAGIQTLDKHELATMGNLKWAVIETNRTTGDTVSVSITDGKLLTTETAKRQFIRFWLERWREVPSDQVAYNKNYATAQFYVSDDVMGAMTAYMETNPIGPFIKSGKARTVQILNVTPNGDGVRYTVDWVEKVYQNSKLVSSTPLTANVDLETATPKTAAEAEGNVFGFLIRGFYWAPPPGI
jgi:type IV secretory pathway TrbF-like protein